MLAAPDFNPVAVMSNRQEPDHGRIRNYTKRVFSATRLKSLEPYIRRRAHEMIDEMLAAGPPADFVAHSFADYMVLGMIITAMPAVNAIPRVVDAPPGIVTYTDLPLPLPRGVVPR